MYFNLIELAAYQTQLFFSIAYISAEILFKLYKILVSFFFSFFSKDVCTENFSVTDKLLSSIDYIAAKLQVEYRIGIMFICF